VDEEGSGERRKGSAKWKVVEGGGWNRGVGRAPGREGTEVAIWEWGECGRTMS
jgi:hypothetical protein